MFSCVAYAQRPNIVKQPPKINGVLKATTNAAMKVKIHANSNSVFGTGNSNNNKYNKKDQLKKEEIIKQDELSKTGKAKKQKK
ncbi:MAG TPA: hypothetical protein VMY77_11535 [Chitinophagaceae bacterium]|nr:hypothetical protein [Chitinophagaceae bacterium]